MNIIVHYPSTEEGKKELKSRVAMVHADFITKYIQNLSCPKEQKIKLLNAVIEKSSSENR